MSMRHKMKFSFVLAFLAIEALAREETVLKTELFAIPVEPSMFNWTFQGPQNQFSYEAALADSPDLPPWIHYLVSERHHSGFLYGVPPKEGIPRVVPLEVVGLNKHSYETRVETVNINIEEKLNEAQFEVHMKIDNLNVEDMFETSHMDALKDIFSKHLWKEAGQDLYVTFLESAIELGARKPLNPKEGEGVVIRLGSKSAFSPELLELQEEVRPLYRMHSCPRDFKRTSVERFFRDAGFYLDWCSFRLLQTKANSSAKHKSEIGDFEDLMEDRRQPMFRREDIPVRSYHKEQFVTLFVPLFIMAILVIVLTFILCLDYGDVINPSDDPIASSQDQSSTQRFLVPRSVNSMLKERTPPDELLLSYANSPNSSMTRGMHCRPSPPPYVRPKYKPQI